MALRISSSNCGSAAVRPGQYNVNFGTLLGFEQAGMVREVLPCRLGVEEHFERLDSPLRGQSSTFAQLEVAEVPQPVEWVGLAEGRSPDR